MSNQLEKISPGVVGGVVLAVLGAAFATYVKVEVMTNKLQVLDKIGDDINSIENSQQELKMRVTKIEAKQN